MDPEIHDKMLAVTSHLTHILSYSLVDTLHSIENDRGEISEGFRVNSFMNATFHAQSDPEMWADIIISNRTNIEAAVQKMQDAMTLYLELAHKGDRKTLVAELTRLRHIRAEQWDAKND
jgi:cyclohexadieny/prephenate dehydrogenase